MGENDDRWQLVNHRLLIKDRWLEVYENDYELPDGSRMEGYHALRERDGVIIVALTEEHEVLLVRQYRPGIAQSLYELLAGFMEPGETDQLERAKSELAEETGYTADEWRALGPVHDAPYRIQKASYCFLALNAGHTMDQHQDQTEFVRYKPVPLAEVLRMIEDNQISSAVMIAAMLKALLTLGQIQRA